MSDQPQDKPQTDEQPQTDGQPAQDDLADMLHSMADGEHPQPADVEESADDLAADESPDDGDHAAEHDAELAAFAEAVGGGEAGVDLNEAFGDADSDEAAAARKRLRRQAGTMSGKSFKPAKFHYVLIRLSLIMGVLLIIPGILGLLALMQGILPFDVPLANKQHATGFAILMLMCWPVSAVLLAGAIYFNKQLKLIEARNQR